MPEIWIPYGGVETLVTVQAENLGTIAQAPTEAVQAEIERAGELAKSAQTLFVCDASPATLDILRSIVPLLGEGALRIVSSAPKKLEMAIPELKGKVATLPPPIPNENTEKPLYATELTGQGPKLFIGTARPDPLFGIIDAKVEACLNWVALSRAIAAGKRKEMEPQPFKKTDSYEAIEEMIDGISEPKFLSAIPRGGRLWTSMEDAPFDAIKNGFSKVQVTQTRGMIVGSGGRGYDDTLSSALRGAWSALEGVRRTGTVLLVAECSEGVGSTALELLATGRESEGRGKKGAYVDGIEDILYLNKLKEEYDVLLLSGLPETYARSRLGLTTSKGAAEAVGRVLNKVGRSGKLNVVPRAPECLVMSG